MELVDHHRDEIALNILKDRKDTEKNYELPRTMTLY